MAINQSALDFAHAARLLGREARGRGLVAPSYRCPPRIVGVQRSLRRFPKGGATVAVQLKGRPWLAVLGDMIEGVVVANGLKPPHADRLRNELWQVRGYLSTYLPSAPDVTIERLWEVIEALGFDKGEVRRHLDENAPNAAPNAR